MDDRHEGVRAVSDIATKDDSIWRAKPYTCGFGKSVVKHVFPANKLYFRLLCEVAQSILCTTANRVPAARIEEYNI